MRIRPKQCKKCKGRGKIDSEICKTCDGNGRVRVRGNIPVKPWPCPRCDVCNGPLGTRKDNYNCGGTCARCMADFGDTDIQKHLESLNDLETDPQRYASLRFPDV